METYLAKGNYDQAMAAVNEMWAKGFETESVLLLEKLADKNYEPALLRLKRMVCPSNPKGQIAANQRTNHRPYSESGSDD